MAGLGESACWDKTVKTLCVLKGRHFLSVEIDGGLETARKAASKALARLP